ncbi:hypothetical protein FOXB_16701 [Fusarium oxysporum f. sp. conglutinans Fo5176]|uniref:Uncharacterized protein n=1 Tax=Fusarium oxysporum (strain Fo5176) TaxID=660025 RepID=F9GDG7_FUSOF|nr:hypothetical protein FOXB_16701 [Fusarium oxysporum f. sp. conglutinans Fo5176]
MRVPDDFESSNEFSSPQLLHSRLAHFCMKEHLWQNPRGRGRPISGLEASAELPWIEGVACQRFFPSREGSKWFEFLQETRNSKKGARLAKSSRPDLSKDVRSLNCNNDEDDFDPEGEDDDNGDGDWDSEDNELDHDDYTYGSDQAEFSREAHPELQIQPDIELDIEAFDDFLEPLYKARRQASVVLLPQHLFPISERGPVLRVYLIEREQLICLLFQISVSQITPKKPILYLPASLLMLNEAGI